MMPKISLCDANAFSPCFFLCALSTAPQVAPRNFKLTAVSPYCVSMSYDPVLYPNGPESGLVYQVSWLYIRYSPGN